MSRRNKILLEVDPKGKFTEGIVATGQTLSPGMIVQKDLSQDMQNGRHAYKVFTRDADGDRPKGAHWVVLGDYLQGDNEVDISVTYAAGERCFLYAPLPGDELNLLYKNVSGTADDVASGDLFIVDTGTGKVIVTTGSPECEVAMALEAVTDPTADQLVWSEWTGH